MVAHAQFLPHIHQMHGRQRPVQHPMGHFNQGIIPAPGHGVGNDAGRGAGQQHRRPFPLPTGRGDFPGVVLGKAVRKIGLLMLLVHDDHAQLFHRREHRGPCPDHDAGVALANAPPFVEPLPGAEPGMQHRHGVAEPGAEPGNHLGRQHDFGHQDNGPFPLPQRFAHQADIDLRLPGAGDSLQKERPGGMSQRWDEFRQRFLLFGRQVRVGRRVHPAIVG